MPFSEHESRTAIWAAVVGLKLTHGLCHGTLSLLSELAQPKLEGRRWEGQDGLGQWSLTFSAQGLVSWKTVFPQTRVVVGGCGFSMIQVHYTYCCIISIITLSLPQIIRR